ncbi:hypothetical protein NMY22_g9200 [Coprinellus aureogranulatus]|nr:hypothetical protein NMY22_g9200 [Coprinellus aureogranulatus]
MAGVVAPPILSERTLPFPFGLPQLATPTGRATTRFGGSGKAPDVHQRKKAYREHGRDTAPVSEPFEFGPRKIRGALSYKRRTRRRSEAPNNLVCTPCLPPSLDLLLTSVLSLPSLSANRPSPNMVGWMPWDLSVRKARAAEFIARVNQSQDFDRDDVPLILQYDERYADMRPWFWPIENGIPIRPDELDRHRHSHYFKMPCCPCTFVNRSPFTETKVGLAQIVLQPGTGHCIGQYVAICSTQQCGYFVALEKYFSHPKLLTKLYGKRDKPLRVTDPFTFVTGDTEETIKRTGLRQMHILRDQSNTGLRGTNKLLRREDPEEFLKAQEALESLLVKGLPAEKFWDVFVQCTSCMYVMPQHHFPFYHPCMVQVVHHRLGLPRALPPPTISALPASDEAFDDTALPGPASSDDSRETICGMEKIFERLAARRQNGADPTTPKARRKAPGP